MKRATGKDASRVTLHDRAGARHFSLGARLPSGAKEEGIHSLWGAGALSHRTQPPNTQRFAGTFSPGKTPHHSPAGAASACQQRKVTPPAPDKGGTRGGHGHPGGLGPLSCGRGTSALFPRGTRQPCPLRRECAAVWGNGAMPHAAGGPFPSAQSPRGTPHPSSSLGVLCAV